MNLSHCQIFAEFLSFDLRWHRTRDSLIPHRWSPECWVGWSVLSKLKKKSHKLSQPWYICFSVFFALSH